MGTEVKVDVDLFQGRCFQVLGVRVDAVQIPDVVARMKAWISSRNGCHYVAVAGQPPQRLGELAAERAAAKQASTGSSAATRFRAVAPSKIRIR